MSGKDKVEVVSTVKTRSQRSRHSPVDKDKRVEPKDTSTKDKTKKPEEKPKKPREKAKKPNVDQDQESSILNMSLFGDRRLGAEVEEGGDQTDSSGDSSEEGVPSVDSKLHVSLEDVKAGLPGKGKIGVGDKASKKRTSQGSLTPSELIRINLEIRKMELEGKKLEFESKNKELASRDKKLELASRDKELKMKHDLEMAKLQLAKTSKVSGSKDGDKDKEKLENVVSNLPPRIDLPRMYEHNFNLDSYLVVFERLATAQGWSRNKWVSRLTSQFNARCQEIFSRIAVSSCQDYDQVKLKLLEGYNLGPETYRKNFKKLERNPTENFKEFAIQLEDVFQKWINGIKCTSFEDLKQTLLLEKFYSSIPKELVALLRDKNLKNLSEASKLADEFDSYREKVFSSQKVTFKENSYSQSNKNPSNDSRMSRIDDYNQTRSAFPKFGNANRNYYNSNDKQRSNSLGSQDIRKSWHNNNLANRNGVNQNQPRVNHNFASPHNQTRPYFRSNRVNFVKTDQSHTRSFSHEAKFCRYCKRAGHLKEQCYFLKLFCNKCQRNGHTEINCYQNKQPYNAFVQTKIPEIHKLFDKEVMQSATVNKVPVQCLRDTGSSISLIRKDLIPNLQLLPELTVCTTAFNTRHTIPLAIINISTKEGIGKLKVGIVEDLQVDLILGNDVKQLKANSDEFNAAITRSRAKMLETVDEIDEPENEQGSELAKMNSYEIEAENNQIDENVTTTEIPVEQEKLNLFKLEPLKGTSRQAMINEQQQDPTLARVRKAISSGLITSDNQQKNATHYYERNGMIFRKFYFENPTKLGAVSSLKQLVVPSKYRRAILSIGHDDPLSAHVGISKCKSIILRNFYWPGIFKDIKQYITSCESCQKVCKKTKRTKVPMVMTPTASRPWDKMIYDVVGPLEKSTQGSKYLLVVVDVHSHYPFAFPLRSIESKHIARTLVNLFSHIGIPRILQHDQASNFSSKMMKQLTALLGIEDIRSSCYRPESNALVERLNGTIKKLIRTCLVGKNLNQWETVLPLVLFAIRATKHATTQLSPFNLVFGYNVRGPLDIVKELWVDEPPGEHPQDLHEYVLDLRKTMRVLSQQAVEREVETKEAIKERFDRSAEMVEFQEGDLVYLMIPQKVSSLSVSWEGPYKILKRLGLVTYQVLVHDKHKKVRVVHTNMLRRYVPRISCFVNSSEEGEEEFSNVVPASFPSTVERTVTSEDVVINPELEPSQRSQLRELLKKYDSIFSNIPGSTNVLRHQIRTINDIPIKCAPYPIPQALIPVAQKEIEVALKLGLISPVINEVNPSGYASPTLLVRKKEQGQFRLCIDHRKLNSNSIGQCYRIADAAKLIDKVSQAGFLSLTDLTRGYNQLRIVDEDVHKTGFLCLGKHYVCNYMSFGLAGAPSTFQLCMDIVLAGMEHFAVAFLDDICIFSQSFEDHLRHLEAVFNALRAANLTANPTKVKLCMNELKFLGYQVGGGKKKVDFDKVELLEHIKIPTTKREIRSYLGCVGFFKNFIPRYSELAAPLTDLLKKTSSELIPWSREAQDSFVGLKSALQHAPVLISPNFTKPFYVSVDSSLVAVGGVLSQKCEGQLKPVLYIGRKFNPTESRLAAVERECLGILSVLNKLRYYLLGRHFYLITDAKSLLFLKDAASRSSKLMRWSLLIAEYDFTISHMAGKLLVVPDYLSRNVDHRDPPLTELVKK